jgi:hypothetical protein
VDSIDDLRSELQRAGEAWVELLRPEFQALRKAIVSEIVRQSNRKTSRRRPDPGKERITRLLQEHPKISNLEICREMDKLQEQFAAYAPVPSWECRLWTEAYHKVTLRVHVYINGIRKNLRFAQLSRIRTNYFVTP